MRRKCCPSHPDRRARRRCFRCNTCICSGCTIRIGLHHFCDTGCSVIHLMQRAAEAEWWVHDCVIREVPVPPRLRRLLERRRQALDAQQVLLRGRATPRYGSFHHPRLLLRRAALLLAPLALLLFWYDNLGVSLYSPPGQVERPAIPRPEVKPVLTPPPELPEKPAEVIPPEVPQPPPFPLNADLSRGPTWERKIALTFDGGTVANATGEILDTLKATGVRATMFLTGQFIHRYPELVRRMVREGHEIGNHTFSHPRLTTFAVNRRQDTLPGVTKEFVQRELRRMSRLFEEVAGTPIGAYWRAPYGEHNREIRQWAAEIGYLHVGWTRDLSAREDLDTRDWVADPHSPIYYRAEEVRERILNFGKGKVAQANGGIVLLHLGTQRRQDRVHRELEAIVDGLRMQGYDLVPVSELHRSLALGQGGKGSAVAAER
ncbi:MAG: polysaccharide deacetylase family protein [candidate division NC10 bacterium]|nr:polysaccharide deacetylase family protein [candidate division NC10 bacterium]